MSSQTPNKGKTLKPLKSLETSLEIIKHVKLLVRAATAQWHSHSRGAAPQVLGSTRSSLHTGHAGHTPPQSMPGQSLHPANESRQAHRNTEFLKLLCKKSYKISPPVQRLNMYYSALKITILGEHVCSPSKKSAHKPILTFWLSLPLLPLPFCHAFHSALFRLLFVLSCLFSPFC